MAYKITPPPHKIKAFTLSEVLITLVIIGVITAITVPLIIQNTQKQEIVTKVKKAYSVLQQSTIRIAIENGIPVGDYQFMTNDDFFDEFAKSVNTIKLCTRSAKGCIGYLDAKTLNGSGWEISYVNRRALITGDGIVYSWETENPNICGGKGLSNYDLQNCIGRFYVDVNGGTPPNKFGHDVFFFMVVQGKGIIPAGAGNNSADCNKKDVGITCAAKVLKENAINYI